MSKSNNKKVNNNNTKNTKSSILYGNFKDSVQKENLKTQKPRSNNFSHSFSKSVLLSSGSSSDSDDDNDDQQTSEKSTHYLTDTSDDEDDDRDVIKKKDKYNTAPDKKIQQTQLPIDEIYTKQPEKKREQSWATKLHDDVIKRRQKRKATPVIRTYSSDEDDDDYNDKKFKRIKGGSQLPSGPIKSVISIADIASISGGKSLASKSDTFYSKADRFFGNTTLNKYTNYNTTSSSSNTKLSQTPQTSMSSYLAKPAPTLNDVFNDPSNHMNTFLNSLRTIPGELSSNPFYKFAVSVAVGLNMKPHTFIHNAVTELQRNVRQYQNDLSSLVTRNIGSGRSTLGEYSEVLRSISYAMQNILQHHQLTSPADDGSEYMTDILSFQQLLRNTTSKMMPQQSMSTLISPSSSSSSSSKNNSNIKRQTRSRTKSANTNNNNNNNNNNNKNKNKNKSKNNNNNNNKADYADAFLVTTNEIHRLLSMNTTLRKLFAKAIPLSQREFWLSDQLKVWTEDAISLFRNKLNSSAWDPYFESTPSKSAIISASSIICTSDRLSNCLKTLIVANVLSNRISLGTSYHSRIQVQKLSIDVENAVIQLQREIRKSGMLTQSQQRSLTTVRPSDQNNGLYSPMPFSFSQIISGQLQGNNINTRRRRSRASSRLNSFG